MRRLQLTCLHALAALAAASALCPRPARASCVEPTPTVVWSYPKDGDTEVPTNITLWLLLSNWHRPGKVLLDGKELPVNGFGFGYRPLEPLAPSSPHELAFQASTPGTEPAVNLTIRFTTGSGETEREPPMTPMVTAVSALGSRPLSNLCQGVVHAMDCFDQAQDTHLVFDTAARPFLWIIEQVPNQMGESPVFTLWPGECELPELFVTGNAARVCGHQYRLHAMEGTGLRAMSAPFCPADLVRAAPGEDGGLPPAPDGGGVAPADAGASGPRPSTGNPQVSDAGGSGGCSVAHGRALPVPFLVLVLILGLARRRRYR